MTKLPETISKKVNVFTGCEIGSFPSQLPPDRCVGGTTAVALKLLGDAQYSGVAFGFDFINYGSALGKSGANNLLAMLSELVTKLGFSGFTFKVMSVEDTRGLRGINTQVIAESVAVPSHTAFGVAVFFDPIIEVVYDLRK